MTTVSDKTLEELMKPNFGPWGTMAVAVGMLRSYKDDINALDGTFDDRQARVMRDLKDHIDRVTASWEAMNAALRDFGRAPEWMGLGNAESLHADRIRLMKKFEALR